jgi:uncharacterized membrane protein
MLSYEVIDHAEEDVLGALHREGGELSYSELVTSTKLPFEIISKVLENLEAKEAVRIETEGGGQAGLRLVRLLQKPGLLKTLRTRWHSLTW